MVLVVPEIVTDGHLLYEKLSLSSVSAPASIWFLVTHTATYHHPVATEHILNMMTLQCHSEKTSALHYLSQHRISQCNNAVKQGENLLYYCERGIVNRTGPSTDPFSTGTR